MTTEQLDKRRRGQMECAIYKYGLCLTKQDPVLVSCKNQVALVVLADIRQQQTTRNR